MGRTPSIPLRESIVWAAAIFVLSVTDAVCTLAHVSKGAGELNPLMDFFLQMSPRAFLTAKISVSAFAACVLCVLLPRIRFPRMCFGSIGPLYAAVCVYHAHGFMSM